MLAFKTMRRGAVVTLLAVGLAACSEGPTAPTSSTFDVSGPLMAKGSGNGGTRGNSGNSSSPGRGKDAGVRLFAIWPGLDVHEKFGDHVLKIPAGITCDPATSGYGTAFWELPCSRATRPIWVTATWAVRNGIPVISFSPDLRFFSSEQENEWATLSLYTSAGIHPDHNYAILWYDKEARRWVDESQTDPTLQARVTNNGTLVKRRIKHFSEWALVSGYGNYWVTSGLGGGESP